MTKTFFLTDIKEALELETVLAEETNLKELEEWDSMTAMILVAYVSENFQVDLTPQDVAEVTTMATLISKIGADKFI